MLPRTKTCGAKNRDLSHVCASARQLQLGKHDVLELFTRDANPAAVRFGFAVPCRPRWRLADSLERRHAL